MTSGPTTQTKQSNISRGLEHEVFLKLVKRANDLSYEVELLVKEQGLSTAHYNILRILRGAGGEGLACHAISERLLVKSPDITRLLDRLEKQALIVRERSQQDRRVVKAFISEAGLDLLAVLDAPVEQLHKKQLGDLGKEKLERLSTLLDELAELREKQ